MQFIRSILYIGFGIGALVVLSPFLLRYLGVAPGLFDPGPVKWVGVIVSTLGAWMYFACGWDFAARGKGTPAFWDPPRALILNPWFRALRNPMYMGVGLMIAGQALWFGSPVLVAYALLVIAGFHVFVVVYEEPHLRLRYGWRYDAYCHRVPRWTPRISRPRVAEQTYET